MKFVIGLRHCIRWSYLLFVLTVAASPPAVHRNKEFSREDYTKVYPVYGERRHTFIIKAELEAQEKNWQHVVLRRESVPLLIYLCRWNSKGQNLSSGGHAKGEWRKTDSSLPFQGIHCFVFGPNSWRTKFVRTSGRHSNTQRLQD